MVILSVMLIDNGKKTLLVIMKTRVRAFGMFDGVEDLDFLFRFYDCS